MSRKRTSSSNGRIITSFVRIPKPLEPGKARCNGCSAVVTVTPTGRLRKHRSPSGDECAYTATVNAPVRLDELPDVHIPHDRIKAKSFKRPEGTPARLEVGSNCGQCGKWLPGERSLCGACAVRNERERRKR